MDLFVKFSPPGWCIVMVEPQWSVLTKYKQQQPVYWFMGWNAYSDLMNDILGHQLYTHRIFSVIPFPTPMYLFCSRYLVIPQLNSVLPFVPGLRIPAGRPVSNKGRVATALWISLIYCNVARRRASGPMQLCDSYNRKWNSPGNVWSVTALFPTIKRTEMCTNRRLSLFRGHSA